MSISVEGQKCPVCKSYMFDDEDIVFCPVCGVPTHRECYNQIKKCPLEEYHGTELEYKAPKTEEKPKEEEPPKEQKEPEIITEKIDFSESEEEQSPFNNPNGAPFTPFGAPFDPYGGKDKNDSIEGISAEEMKHAVSVNSQYYIPKFFEITKQKKTNWNWAAFLIPESFFFFRKCHMTGFLAFVLTVLSTALMEFPSIYVTVTEGMTRADLLNAFTDAFSDPQKLLYSSVAVLSGLVIALVSRIIFGLYGNLIYKNEVFDKIRKAREDKDNDPALALRFKGGVNLFLGAFGLWGVNFFVRLLFIFL